MQVASTWRLLCCASIALVANAVVRSAKETAVAQRKELSRQEPAEACSEEELIAAHAAIEAKQWDETLEKNACVSPEYVRSLRDGYEDPADRFEFMRHPKMPQEAETCSHVLLPKILLIGMNHGGSTTLAHLIHNHPNMSFGQMKEHHYFFPHSARNAFFPDVKPYYNKFLRYDGSSETTEKYKQQFQVDCQVNMTMDASPQNWILGHKKLDFLSELVPTANISTGLQPIKETLGDDVKIILALKEPVAYMSSLGYLDFALDPRAQQVMCIADSLEIWLKEFPRKNFLFLDSGTAFQNLQGTMDSIVHHLGMPKFDLSELPEDMSSSGRRRQVMQKKLYNKVFDTYYADPANRACVTKLSKLTGLTLNWGQRQ